MITNGNNAQTPEQKREIIERLYQLWLKHPEQRLGQLFRVRDYQIRGDYWLIKEIEWMYGKSTEERDLT